MRMMDLMCQPAYEAFFVHHTTHSINQKSLTGQMAFDPGRARRISTTYGGDGEDEGAIDKTCTSARCRNGGRPKIAANATRVVLVKKLHADKSVEIDDICSTLRISRSTFYRYVRL